MISFAFSKEEKLCSRKLIGQLFISGNSFFCYPVKVIWNTSEKRSELFSVQAAFSVPKRNFRKAHDRNLIKRWMRESYRNHKNRFYQFFDSENICLNIMFVYSGKEKLSFKDVESSMNKATTRLQYEYSTALNKNRI